MPPGGCCAGVWAWQPPPALAVGGRWRRVAAGACRWDSRRAAAGVVSERPQSRMGVAVAAAVAAGWLLAVPGRWCLTLAGGGGRLPPLAGGVALLVGAGDGLLLASAGRLQSLLALAARCCWRWRRGRAHRRRLLTVDRWRRVRGGACCRLFPSPPYGGGLGGRLPARRRRRTKVVATAAWRLFIGGGAVAAAGWRRRNVAARRAAHRWAAARHGRDTPRGDRQVRGGRPAGRAAASSAVFAPRIRPRPRRRRRARGLAACLASFFDFGC